MGIDRKNIFIKLMFSAIFVAVCNLVAIKFYFYWTESWVDIPMHIMGGALVASLGLWAIYFSPWKKWLGSGGAKILYVSVGIAFIIGFFWEVFELLAGITSLSVDKIDTVKDLVDDIIGGLIAGWYFVHNIPSKHFHNNEKLKRTSKRL